MKTLITVCVLATLIVFGVSAAGGSPPEGSTEAPMEIAWHGRNEFVAGSVIQGILEEKYNVRLIPPEPWFKYKDAEKFWAVAAAGDLPDIGILRPDVEKAYEQGVIRSIPKDMVKKYAPKVSKYFDQHNGWAINVAPDDPNAFIGFGALIETDYPGTAAWFRLDWLENVGIKPNGPVVNSYKELYYTTEPFDLDQLKKILIAFTKNDPDQDGKADTWGVTTLTDDAITGAFGCIGKPGDDYNHYEDGTVKMYYAMDAYKAYLKYMAELYKAGAVDPDVITGGASLTAAQKWAASWHGYATLGIVYADPDNESFMARDPLNVLNTEPKAKLLMTPYMVGSNGKSQYRGTISRGSLFNNAYFTFIGSEVSDEKLRKILEMFDDINADPEFSVFMLNGEAGLDYDWEGEPFNSMIMKKPGKEYRDASTLGLLDYDATWNLKKNASFAWKPGNRGFLSYVSENLTDQMAIFGRHDIFNETDLGLVLSKNMPEQQVIYKKYSLEAITGKVDVDATWSSYLADLKKAGYDEIMDAYAKTPDVREFISGGN